MQTTEFYKQLIIELVQKIDNEKTLKKIYALVNRISEKFD